MSKELDDLTNKIAKLEKEKLKKERSISDEIDSIKKEKISNATVDMAAKLKKLKKEFSQKQQEEKEKLEKERPLLEEKFRKYVEEHTARIQMHIENAIKELQKAENISEETCVPFDSRVIYKFCTDKYIPDSVDELKKMFPEEIVENFLEDDFYGHPDGRSTGWESEGWSSSSLTC